MLQGTLPASWGALGNLTQLALHNATLNGTLPASWSGLMKLQVLQLQSNQLTGECPSVHCCLCAGQCYLLQTLLCLRMPCHCRITHLTCSHCWALGAAAGPLPSSWSTLPQLSTLRLSGNQLNGTLPPAWASALTELSMNNNQLIGGGQGLQTL